MIWCIVRRKCPFFQRSIVAVLFLLAGFLLPGVGAPAFGQEAEEAAAATKAVASTSEKPGLIPTAHFAGRQALWNTKLSDEGKYVSYFQDFQGRLELIVIAIDENKMVKRVRFSEGSRILSYQWIGEEKLLFHIAKPFFTGISFGERTSVAWMSLDKGGINYVVPNGAKFYQDLVHVSQDGSHVLIAHRGDGRFWYPGVYRYELEGNSEPVQLEEPRKDVWQWVSDEQGTIRLGLGWRKKKLSIWYRAGAGEELARIAKIKQGDEQGFFDVLQIVSGSNTGYVLDEGENGRVGVRLFDYSKREVVETFYENPDWDIETLWIEDGEPIAAFYTDDRDQVVWFSKEDERAFKRLQTALPKMQIGVVARTKSGDRMLVRASNESDPGVLYLYDRETRRLDEFAQYRPEVDFRKLAAPTAFTYKARDGTDIRAYLTLPKGREAKSLPLILLPHGGPFGIRDQLVYNDEVQFLANRGYAVIQPNFRGSGGYGDAFYDLGVGQVGRGMQDDIDDAMDWAVKEGIADPNRVCVVGGSYGGYAALWAVLRNPERYRCAASWAGVTDWDKMLSYDRRVLTRKAGKRWTAKIEGDDKELDLKDVSPYKLARNLNRPVLLAHGTDDKNVPFKQFETMQKAAKKAPVKPTTLVIEGEGHSFYEMESKKKWYDALDTFLAEHNPADQLNAEGNLVVPEAKKDETMFSEIDLPKSSTKE